MSTVEVEVGERREFTEFEMQVQTLLSGHTIPEVYTALLSSMMSLVIRKATSLESALGLAELVGKDLQNHIKVNYTDVQQQHAQSVARPGRA